jgi:hypothetical protein
MKTPRLLGILLIVGFFGNAFDFFGSARAIIIYSIIFSLGVTIFGVYLIIQAFRLTRLRWYYVILGFLMAISQPYFIIGLFVRTRFGFELVPEVLGSISAVLYLIGAISLIVLPKFQKKKF